MLKRLVFTVVAVAALVFESAAQCAMCKMSAEAASETMDRNIGEQVNSGILYLMVIPYIIFFVMFRKKIVALLRELKNAARH